MIRSGAGLDYGAGYARAIWVIPGNHDYYGAPLDDNDLARMTWALTTQLKLRN